MGDKQKRAARHVSDPRGYARYLPLMVYRQSSLVIKKKIEMKPRIVDFFDPECWPESGLDNTK